VSEKKISLKKNFLMNIILSMSSFIFPLITFPYVSRALTPAGYGLFSFGQSAINYFAMLASLGIPTYGIRICAKVRDNKEELTKVTQELLLLNLATALFSYLLLFISIVFVGKFNEEKTLLIVMSLSMFLTAIGMEWFYKALEQYTYITIRSLFFKFIALIFMFILIHSEEDYVIYGAIAIFASGASNILNFLNIHRYISLKPVGNYDFKRHLKPILIFFAMSCATIIYTNMDVLMLGFMRDDAEVGYYEAAVKIKKILVAVVTSLSAVLLPRASYYIEKGEIDRFKQIASKALNFICIFSIPVATYFIIYASEGIYFLSGAEYAASILPMQILMPTLLFIGLSNILGVQILVPLGKEKLVFYSEVVGALTDLILNYLFIPQYGASGAAFATLVAELLVFVVQAIFLRGKLKDLFKGIDYFGIILATVLSALASYGIKLLGLNYLFTLLLAAIIFFGIYALILYWRKEKLFMEIINTGLNLLKHYQKV